MPRKQCCHCHYPSATCVCAAVRHLSTTMRITILQHPDETHHAKGTARLVKLVMPATQIVIGQSREDFRHFFETLYSSGEASTYLVFPTPSSSPITSIMSSSNSKEVKFATTSLHLIFIDATWRKAKKILAINAELDQLPALHLDTAVATKYFIRKSNRTHGMSTLEAVATCLSTLENLDTSPLLDCFDYMQTMQTANMPEKVKRRYFS